MSSIRRHLTYANVMSSLLVFLVLGGATAFAADQLAKKSVGTKQLKSNAVTAAKIKKNAVTRAKIKNGAVNGAKIADGSITGTEINAVSTSFSQVVTRLRGTATVPFTTGTIYPLASPTYTQNAGEDNQYLATLDVSFAASCTQPRAAQAFLMVDPANPNTPTPNDVVGVGIIQDTGSGAANRKVEFSPVAGASPMSRFSPAAATQHTFYIFMLASACTSGSGVSATGASLDVIGTK